MLRSAPSTTLGRSPSSTMRRLTASRSSWDASAFITTIMAYSGSVCPSRGVSVARRFPIVYSMRLQRRSDRGGGAGLLSDKRGRSRQRACRCSPGAGRGARSPWRPARPSRGRRGGDVGPAELAGAGGGEVGVEVAGGGEEGAGHGARSRPLASIIRVRSTWVLARMDSAVFSSMEVAPRTPRAVMTVAPRRSGRRSAPARPRRRLR